MNKVNQAHPHADARHDRGNQDAPYWKRAHRDWKFWIAVLLTTVAIVIYIGTIDLSIHPNGRMQQQVP